MLTTFLQENRGLLLDTLRELCVIPAPSGAEQARAEYCKAWLERAGATDVIIDDACNVLLPLHRDDEPALTVVVAHTDVVFPDTAPLPLREDEQKLYCPGIGDNSASAAVLLLVAKYFLENSSIPHGGLLLVWNSGEEGLGNLKGTRAICDRYAGRTARFLSFDCHLDEIATRCVGSHRYELTVRTEGGHSYLAFGKPNAIAVLSGIIQDIYAIDTPPHTTYNVGTIEGGTSINTIAPTATVLCEYRSDDAVHLRDMEEAFCRIFDHARRKDVAVDVKRIGERPCMGAVDLQALTALIDTCKRVTADVTGTAPREIASSTDCNIPLSLGIPSVCIGVYAGDGMHTREEWVDKASLIKGLEIAVRILKDT